MMFIPTQKKTKQKKQLVYPQLGLIRLLVRLRLVVLQGFDVFFNGISRHVVLPQQVRSIMKGTLYGNEMGGT